MLANHPSQSLLAQGRFPDVIPIFEIRIPKKQNAGGGKKPSVRISAQVH